MVLLNIDVVMRDLQRIEDIQKIYKIQASENSRQFWFMFFDLFILDDVPQEIQPISFYRNFWEIFTTVCVL